MIVASKVARRWLAGLVAAGGAFALLAVSVPPAHAAPVVDPSQTGTVVFHKLKAPSSGSSSEGLEVSPAPGNDPVPGVTFTLTRVPDIDLTTDAGWQTASELTVSTAQALATGVTGVTCGPTDAQGECTRSGLPLGVYIVEETGVPAGVTPAATFLLTLPLTHPTNADEWLYTVHLYPKDGSSEIGKVVDDSDAWSIGDPVVFTITASIPEVDPILAYKIVDPIDPKLTFVSASVAGLTEGTHYTVSQVGTLYGSEVWNIVTIEFTQAGLLALVDLWDNQGTTHLTATVNTTVNDMGTIRNTAWLFPNEGSFEWVFDPDACPVPPAVPGAPCDTGDDPEEPDPSDEVTSKWGALALTKVNGDGDLLAGAEFQVFKSETDARAKTGPLTAKDADGYAVDTFVSDATGELLVRGLRFSDYADGVQLDPVDERIYWLVETKAPDGYELLAEPIQFTITADNTTNLVYPLEVTNVEHNSQFELPLTGGTGTALLTVAGVLVLGGAVLLAIRRRRSTTA